MTGNLESWSRQLRNDTKMSPQLKSSFLVVTSIVYGFYPLKPTAVPGDNFQVHNPTACDNKMTHRQNKL